MIREEYAFKEVSDYLYRKNELVIVGAPSHDERSHFFYNEWNSREKDILFLSRENNEQLKYQYISKGTIISSNTIDLCIATPRLLHNLKVEEKNVLLDMSSLDHVLIMFLTKQLLTNVIPRSFFSSYIRPVRYDNQSGDIGYSLSNQILAVEAVPGFSKRESDKQTLCTFLGFEGIRLKKILETVHNIEKFVPIVAFPSGAPQWYNTTMWNSMDTLQSEGKESAIYKCFSESIFEAVELLRQSIEQDEKLVLAPLGTRPHSMSCAVFACEHPNTRIIYDYVVENDNRAIGISDITIYHLSSFLKT